VRVGVERLAVDEARAGAGERLRQQVGAHAVAVAGDGHHAQPGGAGGDDGAQVGRRLDQDGVARRRQRAERGRQRGLAARADDDVVRAQAPAGLAGEPGAQLLAPLDGSALPGAGAPRGAGQRRSDHRDRLQVERQIAAGERDRAGWRDGQQLLERLALDGTRPERHRLPREVGRRLGLRARCHEGPAAGPWLEDALRGERSDRALHSDRRGAVAGHQLAHGGQAVAGRARAGARTQILDDARLCVIVEHEWRG
jgi:hypothetical protein